MKKSIDEIEIKNDSTFLELINFLKSKKGIFIEIFEDDSIKFFLNLEEVNDFSLKLKDGDEIAFLPPVTGG